MTYFFCAPAQPSILSRLLGSPWVRAFAATQHAPPAEKDEAIKRTDVLFDIERGINSQSVGERLRVRRESAPLLAELQACLRDQRLALGGRR
jgi:hypothetical protein